jgi:hypothetical protein
MRLEDWPTPPKTNGVGGHFGTPSAANIDEFLPLMKALHMTWVVLADDSKELIGRAVPKFLDNGIMPIVRVNRKINRGQDWYDITKITGSPYTIIYNEPSREAEWAGNIPGGWWEKFRDKWIGAAYAVQAAGSHPGLQVESPRGTAKEPSGLRDMLLYMKERGETSLWEGMWLALHLYPEIGCPPSATCHDSDALGFLQYAAVCEEIMGFVPPMIVTEWAWTPSQAKPSIRAKYVTDVYGWFRDGRLPDGTPLPDYLFAFCYWILFGQIWFGFSLAGNIEHQPVIEAVKAMGEWERGKPTPAPPPEDPKTWQVVSELMTQEEAEYLIGFWEYNHRDMLGLWHLEERK